MPAPRPGSRKATVYQAFDKDGEQAAYEAGARVGVKEGSVRSWIGGWMKERRANGDAAPASNRVRIPKEPQKGERVRIPKPSAPPKDGKVRAYIKGDANKELGLVIKEGPEQTEIKWPDGRQQAYPNHWLRYR